MSWEDTLASVLPALLPLYRHLHQLLGPALALYLPPLPLLYPNCVFLHVHVLFHYVALCVGAAGDVTNATRLCLDSRNTTQTRREDDPSLSVGIKQLKVLVLQFMVPVKCVSHVRCFSQTSAQQAHWYE